MTDTLERSAQRLDESSGVGPAIPAVLDESAEPLEPRLSLLRRTLRRMGIAVSVLATIAMIAIAIGMFWFHVGIKPVLSGSMRPTFVPGSVIITRAIPTTKVRPGDVILFTPPGETSPFAHRVTSVSGPADHPIITTKGDANPVADSWKAQILSSQVPEVIGSVAGVGRVIVYIHGHGSRLILIALSGLIFCILGTRSILGPRPSLEVAEASD